MNLKSLKKSFLFLFLTVVPQLLYSQLIKHEQLFSFEEEPLPSSVSEVNSRLSLSGDHYKDGTHSLKWEFQPGGELILKKELGFEQKDPTGKDTYLSTFVIWIYNERPTEDFVTFEFLKDGKKCTSFPFGLHFKGWRAAWVSYERDMEGTPQEGMNELRIKAPDREGTLFVDHLIPAVKADHRHHTPDVQAPFVNKETTSHWLILLKLSRILPDIPAEARVSDRQVKDIRVMEERFHDLIHTPSAFTPKGMESIVEEYNSYGIVYKDGKISGLPVFFGRAAEAFERLVPDWRNIFDRNGMEFRKYFTLMNRMATAYHNTTSPTEKEELARMFLAMYDHAADQGIASGSGLGNLTHYGYSFRGMFTSYYLMKEVLKKAGRLEEAQQTMQWYATVNEIFIKPEKYGMDMDAFNTITTGRISSILIMDDSPEKVQYLKAFSRWINNGCMPAPGLDGSFKPDGGAFHHRNNYPAYAVGGLTGATQMIRLLSRTSFAVSQPAHQTVKNVLKTMRFYCNKKHFPLSMSGRHPDGRGELIPNHYAQLAMAGTPDGKDAIDREMAAAYLRLMSVPDLSEKPEYMPSPDSAKERKAVELFLSEGIEPEKDPSGNLALGYGCVSVQRRENWAAVVRGHSRYLWAAEHYLGANLYGRYLAHGSMQVLTAPDNEEVTPKTSGWIQEGFDWGRIPGATAIHLPVEQLKANVLNVDVYSGFEEMLYSDEAFAGGLSQEGKNGVFGMKLHEHDKYNGSHRARKSYHFFGGKIICLGSDIENDNEEYPTETTLFQLAVTDERTRGYWKNYAERESYWIDHLNTGYYIPLTKKKGNLRFEKNFPQFSRMQNTGEETSGDWVVLAWDHGKAPKGKEYEYAIIPGSSEKEMKQFAKKVPYRVLQKDKNAHIVKETATNTVSYVLFETPGILPPGPVTLADTACLIMARESDTGLLLTVCNPDLALYRGPSDELLDENGKRVERSIYSRPWISHESMEVPVTVTVKGKWKVPDNPSVQWVESDTNKTVIRFLCKDAASIEVELIR